jgi:uncharacterized phage protein (TIGR02218 family)
LKTISVALKAELAKGSATLAVCLRILRTDGNIYGFTNHDQKLTVSGQDYVGGFIRSDIATNSDLSVDNLNIKGILATGYFDEDDLRAGLWDFAECRLFLVNWADLTQGVLKLRRGRIGEVSTGRSTFDAEFRGMLQALTRSIGRTDQPGCDYVLGDSRCTKDLTAFTVTGTLEGVSDDGMTLFDSARAEDGPSGGVVITAITADDPAVITAAGHGFIEGELIALSEIVGPTSMNVLVQVRSPTTDTFSVDIDSTDLPAYVSGGVATPYADSGYFDGGLITIDVSDTAGLNVGISREVRAFVPGQWTLQLPFPNPLLGTEEYTMIAGCDKSLATCKTKFDNKDNHGGLPFLRGTDAMLQVGRR